MRGAPPVLWTGVGFAAGAAANVAIGFDRAFLPLLAIGCPILLWRGPKSRIITVALCFIAGLAWANSDNRSRSRCTSDIVDGATARVGGYFTATSVSGASRMKIDSGLAPGCTAQINVYSRSDAPPEAVAVTVEGRWLRSVRPNGTTNLYLSASEVRASPGVGTVPLAVRLRSAIRERASEALEHHLGSQAGVASALVLAEREGIPQELWDAFARSGSAHLLSISGFHVGVIAALLSGLLVALGQPPRRCAVGVLLGVWAYVLIIGAPTSATRAAWMTTAFVLGRLRQSPTRTLGGLALSMLMITLFRPEAVAGAGFQLTVTGTAGILILTKWITSHWPVHPGRAWIVPPIAAGIGASVFTAPVLAYHFGQIPLLSLPASIVLTPLVAAAVPGVLLAILMDVAHIPGAGVAGAGSEGLLQAVTTIAEYLGSLPGTVWTVTPTEVGLLTAGALMPILFANAPWRSSATVRTAVATLSACAFLWLGQAALSLAGWGTIEVVAIDVGQGDAIAVRTPKGRWYLVDAGPRFGGADAGLTRVVPFLRSHGVRRLESVVLTHPDEDHAGGLKAVLSNISTGAVLGPGLGAGQAGQMDGLEVAKRANVPWRKASAGDSWSVDGVVFQVLSPVGQGGPSAKSGQLATPDPASPNDWSIVLRVSFGDFDALLMGDADDEIEATLLDQGPIDLLKVGHHGSHTSSSAEFVRAISPRYALISVGGRNRYGHPHPKVLARLEAAGTQVYRTDQRGTVSVTGRRDGTATVTTGR